VGELERVIKAGGDVGKVIFSGVGKTAAEMRRALEAGVLCFNVESEAELVLLNKVAGGSACKANVSLRVNPDVDAKTHPYISTGLKQNKFGISIDSAKQVYLMAAEMAHINIEGIDCHIGSQLCEIEPFVDALDRVLILVAELKTLGIDIKHIDVGGGLGITYNNETPPSPADYAQAILSKLKGTGLQVLCEPGRAIAGNAGILMTKVQYLKQGEEKHFAIIDAAMNDLIRPSLYDAWQNIIPVRKGSQEAQQNYDIVGPICETGDFLGKDRLLSLQQGDLLAICSAGAYGFVMSSNYNTRPRVAEVMVDGDRFQIIRERETISDLLRGETILKDR